VSADSFAFVKTHSVISASLIGMVVTNSFGTLASVAEWSIPAPVSVSQYLQKLRHEMGRRSCFVMNPGDSRPH